jgi:Flp pilus assembly CpaF family ATPase
VIEDTVEIRLSKPHVISSESQSSTHRQEISFDVLLKAALRHRPDRIILGEVRGPEARTLLDEVRATPYQAEVFETPNPSFNVSRFVAGKFR